MSQQNTSFSSGYQNLPNPARSHVSYTFQKPTKLLRPTNNFLSVTISESARCFKQIISLFFILSDPEKLRQYSDYATGWMTVVQFPTGTEAEGGAGILLLRHLFQTGSWGPTSFLSTKYLGFLPRDQNDQGVILTTSIWCRS